MLASWHGNCRQCPTAEFMTKSLDCLAHSSFARRSAVVPLPRRNLA